MPPPPPPGPSWPPGGQQPYGGYGQPTREHPDGTTVLVLGILGIVVCGILAPIAWVKGNAAKREIDAHPEIQWSNAGAVTAGRICGIIGTVLVALGILAFVMFVVLIAAAGST